MTRFNYSRIANIALTQITRFGQSVTITRKLSGSGVYNTNTGTVTKPDDEIETGTAIVDTYKSSEIDGTLIQVGDVKLILAAIGITEPTINDKITLADGVMFSIKKVEPLSPSGSPVIYTCQLRK